MRTAAGYAGDLGRRIRSHELLPGQDSERILAAIITPAASPSWMAGGGVKPGFAYGETDELGYNVVQDGLHIHDLHATVLHLLGIDHERLTYKFQGRRYRLTDVHGRVVPQMLA